MARAQSHGARIIALDQVVVEAKNHIEVIVFLPAGETYTAYGKRLSIAWLQDCITKNEIVSQLPYVELEASIPLAIKVDSRKASFSTGSSRSTLPSRGSRRLLGRAASASLDILADIATPNMTDDRNLRDSTAQLDQIAYSDPDAVEQQFRLRAVLLEKENEFDTVQEKTSKCQEMTRAAGLDMNRRLRR